MQDGAGCTWGPSRKTPSPQAPTTDHKPGSGRAGLVQSEENTVCWVGIESWPSHATPGPPPSLASSSLVSRRAGAPQARNIPRARPPSPRTHLPNLGSDGLHADGADEAQTCGGGTRSPQLSLLNPSNPELRRAQLTPGVPRDPRGQQSLGLKWPMGSPCL